MQVRDDHGIVLVHDGVRPFVTGELIGRAVAAAEEHGAAAVGLPVRDTVKAVSAAGVVVKTVDREGLWLTQTPQAFRRQLICAAYEKAAQDGFLRHRRRLPGGADGGFGADDPRRPRQHQDDHPGGSGAGGDHHPPLFVRIARPGRSGSVVNGDWQVEGLP